MGYVKSRTWLFFMVFFTFCTTYLLPNLLFNNELLRVVTALFFVGVSWSLMVKLHAIIRYVELNSSKFFSQVMLNFSEKYVTEDISENIFKDHFNIFYSTFLPNIHFVKSEKIIGFVAFIPNVCDAKKRLLHVMNFSFLTGVILAICGQYSEKSDYALYPKSDNGMYFDVRFYGNFSALLNSYYWRLIPFVFGFKLLNNSEKLPSRFADNGVGFLRDNNQKISWEVLDSGEVKVVYVDDKKALSKPMFFKNIDDFSERFNDKIYFYSQNND